jgi:spectinomycin phosphotransferase
MLERPALSDAEIAGTLQTHFGIQVNAIHFLPIGNAVNSFAFKVDATGGNAFFLKARRGEVDLATLTIAQYARAQGVPAVAPIATQTGELCADAGGFHLILYPFIYGESGMDAGMSDAQWVAYGAALRKLHDLLLPQAVSALLPVEDFSASHYFQDVLQRIDAIVGSMSFSAEPLRGLAAFWLDKAGEIEQIAKRARALGEALKATTWRGVLCHADIHTANVMIERAGAIFFVDWDQPIFAPRERDLMFIIGAHGSVGLDERQEALFFQGYGAVEIDWTVLAYYRHLWVLQDLGDYAERAFLMNDASDAVRAHAAAGFKAMFDAGDVIEIARRAGERVP